VRTHAGQASAWHPSRASETGRGARRGNIRGRR
jgi:hypothetical protein